MGNYKAPSTTVLIANESNAPTQMPIANGRTSCNHSGQPVTAFRVARKAETCLRQTTTPCSEKMPAGMPSLKKLQALQASAKRVGQQAGT